MTPNEYNTLRYQVIRFVGINGYRRAAKMLGVSINALKRFCDGYTIRPTTAEKININFNK